ncbi:MAG: hypothetical protein ABH851_08565 [Methanobacteriota archaeon]
MAEKIIGKPPREKRPNYFNNELAGLTERFPVAEVLGEGLESWKVGNYTGLDCMGMFNSSPANNSEFQAFLGQVVHEAAKEGKWVGIDTGWTPAQTDDFLQSRGGAKPLTDYGRGLDRALTAEFIALTRDGDKTFVTPTEGTVAFLKERLS